MPDQSLDQVVRAPRWRIALPVGALSLLVGAVAYIVARNPYTTEVTYPCLLLHTTGLFCPGCGGTRAVYDLAHGDIAGALGMNAFVTLLLIPPLVGGLVWWLLHTLGVKMPQANIPMPVVWSYLGLLLAFSVIRNVPYFEPFLSPV